MSQPVLFIAIERSLWLLSREGDEWDFQELHTTPSRIQALALDHYRAGVIYCGTSDDGLWRGEDGGQVWERIGAELHPRVSALAVGPRSWEEDIIFAGTQPTTFYRSTDGGDSWEECPSLLELPSAPEWRFPPRPETSHIRWIAPDPHLPGHLYLAIEAGALVRTNDWGDTWEDRQPGGPYDTHELVLHPESPGRLYSAAGDGYFESEDGGLLWERHLEGLEARYAWSVVVDPNDPDRVIISTAPSARAAHRAGHAESYLYRKTAEDAPWQQLDSGLPDPEGTTVSLLAHDPYDPATVYAINNRGIYRSMDWGEFWDRLDLSWSEEFSKERIGAVV